MKFSSPFFSKYIACESFLRNYGQLLSSLASSLGSAFKCACFCNLQTLSERRETVAPPWADRSSSPCAYVAAHRDRRVPRRLFRSRCSVPCRGSWRHAAPNCGAPPRMQFRAAASRPPTHNVNEGKLYAYHPRQIKRRRGLCQLSAIKRTLVDMHGASNCAADVI